MKPTLLNRVTLYCAVLLLSACGNSAQDKLENITNPTPQTNFITSHKSSTYSVNTVRDVVYAKGLSHKTWNSDTSSEMDLLLDIYTPNNNLIQRPAVVLIHGGGFYGGDKGKGPIPIFATYFAERGFVAISINYRLVKHRGTIPNELNAKLNASSKIRKKQTEQARAIYPATRDAKAALRWLAANADEYGVNPELVSVIGGSAGSFIAVALGATEKGDFTDEISAQNDPSILTTNLNSDIKVKAIVNHWGGTAVIDVFEKFSGITPWDESDAPISIVHGTEDSTVPFSRATDLVNIYKNTGAYYELTPLEGAKHGAWNAKYKGQPLQQLSFDFITRMLKLPVVE